MDIFGVSATGLFGYGLIAKALSSKKRICGGLPGYPHCEWVVLLSHLILGKIQGNCTFPLD
jgi:hypothetical protein